MSQTPVSESSTSTTLYRYLIVTALSVVVLIGLTLFWRARVIERRLALLRALQPIQLEDGLALGKRPRLYDVYLDGHGGRGTKSWSAFLSFRFMLGFVMMELEGGQSQIRICVDGRRVDPPATVTLMITMPMPMPELSSTHTTRSPQPSSHLSPQESSQDIEDEGEPSPHVEFGLATCSGEDDHAYGYDEHNYMTVTLSFDDAAD
ncbi:hypothetical protein B0H13DRAFT_2346133 [Mycena leptocephala]|nr:hypothetical protein B0H13DRAFT_2346133 [Mycena leptocephala]